MAGERILYVCCDPTVVVSRERLLVAEGFDVHTVLGPDGILAAKQISDFDYVLIGDEGSALERQKAIGRVREGFFPPPIIALCQPSERLRNVDYVIIAQERHSWCDSLVNFIRRQRRLA